jgi:hypothetical protein
MCGIATRYDKLAVIYRGGAILRAITIWLKPLGDTPAGCPSCQRSDGPRATSGGLRRRR